MQCSAVQCSAVEKELGGQNIECLGVHSKKKFFLLNKLQEGWGSNLIPKVLGPFLSIIWTYQVDLDIVQNKKAYFLEMASLPLAHNMLHCT